MWRTAERRFVRHVCLRNPFPLFLLAVCSMQSLPEAWRSWERKYQLCVIAASCPSFRCSCRKRRVSRREAEGLVTDLWFPRFVTIQLLCSQLCYVTAANQWTIVEIELLATVGWKCGCQPFSCRCTQNVRTGERRLVRHVCCRNPCLLWNLSLHSLPEAWGSWELQKTSPAPHYGCIMPAKDRVVVSKIWITGYGLWSRRVGSGAASVSAAHLRKMCGNAKRRFMGHVSWLQALISAILSSKDIQFMKRSESR